MTYENMSQDKEWNRLNEMLNIYKILRVGIMERNASDEHFFCR